ncbi:hypothetical protein SYNTR_1113 [Candidatus Syntrophocurvum alkaliphilum]|uniref:Uncharacterized protein n=1 Tax=Candidatus Syntrophocurvum alkaliphilum TaxID=2293317 RepID=A0A6I6DET3_9FIRM|nr:hypothetical protein [Candidatus Syntrophocurvum alkaliphilum]QGT99706.1 hypothetical protein SYNTR_1113 [Candidatus Syntrophocurvum alkaliphilum]
MRTLIATVLYNSKGKEVYCTAKKVSDQDIKYIKSNDKETLEDLGFTFINLNSPEFTNVKGYAIFFEGHVDQMTKILKSF